jgi:hypothetical protein
MDVDLIEAGKSYAVVKMDHAEPGTRRIDAEHRTVALPAHVDRLGEIGEVMGRTGQRRGRGETE